MTRPFVSVVVPVFDDAAHVHEALASCLAQSDPDLEVVAVDDGSRDETAEILDAVAGRDARVRVLRHGRRRTAFQARRTGVLAARGEYLMFLDGDDSIAPGAVATLKTLATDRADLLHFGVRIVGRDGRRHPRFEDKLRPTARRLTGADILATLFPEGRALEGHLWNKAYRTLWAQPLFAGLPDNVEVPRANDLPVSLLLAARAETYVSTRESLYRYHFGSGLVADTMMTTDRFRTTVTFRPAYDVIVAQAGSWDVAPQMSERLLRRVCIGFVERSVALLGQLPSAGEAELQVLLDQWPALDVAAALHARLQRYERLVSRWGAPLRVARQWGQRFTRR